MSKVIGICGKKSSGKSSVCSLIIKMLPSLKVKEMSFAKTLKDLAIDVFGLDKKYVHGSESDKNYPISTWGDYFHNGIIDKYNKRYNDLLTGREFMQLLGTEVMRSGDFNKMSNQDQYEKILLWLSKKAPFISNNPNYDYNNIWIDILINDIEKQKDNYDIILISDVRFINELICLKKAGAKLIRLYRDVNTYNSIPHSSELEMDKMQDKDFDHVLHEENNINMTHLRNFAIKVLTVEGFLGQGFLV